MKNYLSLLRIEELLFLAFSFATLLGTFQDHEEKNQYWKIHRQIAPGSSFHTIRSSCPLRVHLAPADLTPSNEFLRRLQP